MTDKNKTCETLTYTQKMAIAHREAKATVIALLITIAAWLVLGFGLSGLPVYFLGIPLWVIGGTLGTWICAIVVAYVLIRGYSANMSFDETPSKKSSAVRGAHE